MKLKHKLCPEKMRNSNIRHKIRAGNIKIGRYFRLETATNRDRNQNHGNSAKICPTFVLGILAKTRA